MLPWIWEHVKDLKFESVLDVFGGTGSVSLMFKRYGKKVLYNDLLKFNQIIGLALVENHTIKVSEEDITSVLQFSDGSFPNFIQREYKGIFFKASENTWIDRVVTNINRVEDKYKRAVLMASLFQACLAKRPFNLFHRANLYLRTANVKRTFGNKTTWERPFPELFTHFAFQYNHAVFTNGKRNRVIGGFDATSVPNGVDLVYLDPPYVSSSTSQATSYLAFYHFLEGLADYATWSSPTTTFSGKTKRIADYPAILNFARKDLVTVSFAKLFDRFQDSLIVLSYRSDGVPSKEEIIALLKGVGKKVKVLEKDHHYVLSKKVKKELLFIAT